MPGPGPGVCGHDPPRYGLIPAVLAWATSRSCMAAGLALDTLQSFPQLSSTVAYRVSANFNRENPDSMGAHCDFLHVGYRSKSPLHRLFLYFLELVPPGVLFLFVRNALTPTMSYVQYQRSTGHCTGHCTGRAIHVGPHLRKHPPFISKMKTFSKISHVGSTAVILLQFPFEPT
jgi:hypothetical protein